MGFFAWLKCTVCDDVLSSPMDCGFRCVIVAAVIGWRGTAVGDVMASW
jgi:hypothetical protein